mmetsp:Transcript_7774/g.12060  ORF Transcript_7774/g.12060 Transcript_7774/m.12060 type:complete len:86 (+) Transcript_7774:483-740(+)
MLRYVPLLWQRAVTPHHVLSKLKHSSDRHASQRLVAEGLQNGFVLRRVVVVDLLLQVLNHGIKLLLACSSKSDIVHNIPDSPVKA